MLIELVTILTFLLSGSVAVKLLGIRGWITPFLGFVLGISIFISVGFVQIVTPLPTWPIITLATTILLPLVAWRILPKQKLDINIRTLVITLLLTPLTVVFFRSANIINWSNDSFGYIESSILIADNQFTLNAMNTITKRVLGAPLLHSPAQLGNEFYLQSLSPLLSISTLLIMVWVVCRSFNLEVIRDKWLVYSGAILGALLLATNQRYLFNSFYLSGHLLFSSLFLVVVACGWLVATKNSKLADKNLVVFQSIVFPALTVTRPEATLVVLLAILPTLLLTRLSWKLRALPLITAGVATIMWQGFVALQYSERGQGLPIEAVGLLLLGVVVLLGVKLLNIKWLKDKSTTILLSAEASLWAILLLFTILNPTIAYRSLYSIYQNLILGKGLWGLSMVILGYFALIATVLTREKTLSFLRFPLTAFVPLMFIIAYLREGAYRVGAGDSFNRMLLHILPLLVLYIIVATISILLSHQSNRTRQRSS